MLISGGCGRTPLLDEWRNPSVDAQVGHEVGDASDSKRDGVTVGHDAVAVASCSPNDAMAVSIQIGVDRPSCGSISTGSYLGVDLWYTSWDNLKPGIYVLDANGGIGMSVVAPVHGSPYWEPGTNTVLSIESIDAERMTGHCEASFPSGTVSVDFTAQWCGGHPRCG